MDKAEIKDIADVVNACCDDKNPLNKPIVFIGAGASVSAGIPGAAKIMSDIVDKYPDNNKLKQIAQQGRTYYNIMGSLTAVQRHKILRGYVTSRDVSINVAHIYLAQMLHESKVDYVLTVNFDDLLLRACALFNFIPPVYDLSILANNFTTGNIQEKSVTYLHGQHHGLWRLNTPSELAKVHKASNDLFNKISASRTWIIIGYSGEDEILNNISALSSFDNNLYWIGYRDIEPSEKVKKQLLDLPNSNAFWVPGYDADSFFLQLHSELKMDTPRIFNRPFSFLQNVIKNIRDININAYEGTDYKEKFVNVKERFEIISRQVNEAILTFENKKITIATVESSDIEIDSMVQEIIEAYIKNDYGKAEFFLNIAKTLKNERVNSSLSDLYYNWGTDSVSASNLQFSLEKFETSTYLNNLNAKAYNNWGYVLRTMAGAKNDIVLLERAIEKYKKATEIAPEYYVAHNNWGNALYEIGKIKKEKSFFLRSIEKFSKATSINPQYLRARVNQGKALIEIAKLESDKELYLKGIEHFEKALDINPQYSDGYESFSYALIEYSKSLQNQEKFEVLLKAKDNVEKLIALGGRKYNLACIYALMGQGGLALQVLDDSLRNEEINVSFVQKDSDWDSLKNDSNFLGLLDKYTNL